MSDAKSEALADFKQRYGSLLKSLEKRRIARLILTFAAADTVKLFVVGQKPVIFLLRELFHGVNFLKAYKSIKI